MSFRVLIAGGRRPSCSYVILHTALDTLLANRLPDVELLTAGGNGVPMLAASYATERNLKLTALVPDFRRFPTNAPERRDGMLVAMADAAVVVWDDRDPALRHILKLVEARGIPVHVIGAPAKQKVKQLRDPEEPSPRRGLPD